MTKEITKARIIQELSNKFGLREFEPEPFTLSERVVPTYNIGQHLISSVIEYKQILVTSAPLGYLFYTVPEDEKWTLEGYNVVFMAAGAYKVTGVFISHYLGSVDSIYLDMKEGQTVSYAVNLPTPLVLEPKNCIFLYIDDYTSNANLRLYIRYRKETLR